MQTATTTLLARPMPGDIDQRLADIIADWDTRPFAWGVADCCQFVADAANRLYGLDLRYGPYHTEFGAARLLAHLGQLGEALKHAGFASLANMRLAQRGDVVVWRVPADPQAATTTDQPAIPIETRTGLFASGLALCVGSHAMAKSRDGLQAIPPAQWLAVWRYSGPVHAPAPAHTTHANYGGTD